MLQEVGVGEYGKVEDNSSRCKLLGSLEVEGIMVEEAKLSEYPDSNH